MDVRRAATWLDGKAFCKSALTVNGQRLDDLPQQDVEHALPMPAPLLAHVGRSGCHDHEIQVGDDEDVLATVAPGETGVVAADLVHPPQVAIAPVAHRVGDRIYPQRIPSPPAGAELARAPIARFRHPPFSHDLPSAGAPAAQVQLAEL